MKEGFCLQLPPHTQFCSSCPGVNMSVSMALSVAKAEGVTPSKISVSCTGPGLDTKVTAKAHTGFLKRGIAVDNYCACPASHPDIPDPMDDIFREYSPEDVSYFPN